MAASFMATRCYIGAICFIQVSQYGSNQCSHLEIFIKTTQTNDQNIQYLSISFSLSHTKEVLKSSQLNQKEFFLFSFFKGLKKLEKQSAKCVKL